MALQVLQFLVTRKFQRGMIFTAWFHALQRGTDCIQMIGLRGLPAGAGKLHVGSPEWRLQRDATSELGLGFGHVAVEGKLDRMEKMEIASTCARHARTLQQRERSGMLAYQLPMGSSPQQYMGLVAVGNHRQREQAACFDQLTNLDQCRAKFP